MHPKKVFLKITFFFGEKNVFFPPTSWKRQVSPLLALCVFLVCERHRGDAADWFPYIDVLPTSYTCPVYFADEVMAVLPPGVQRKAREQRDAVRELHSFNKDFFRCLIKLHFSSILREDNQSS